jgi:hypothetical protein
VHFEFVFDFECSHEFSFDEVMSNFLWFAVGLRNPIQVVFKRQELGGMIVSGFFNDGYLAVASMAFNGVAGLVCSVHPRGLGLSLGHH